jgi:beta-glucanase (GH16 family)
VIGPRAGWHFDASHSDEFDGVQLDSLKWNADMKDWGKWSWEPQNVSVQDGSLRLQMLHAPHDRDGETFAYTSGAVVSRTASFRYAYVEARIKAAPRFPGVSTAFWLFRNTPELWTEIDVVELTQHVIDPSVAYFNTHVLRHPELTKGRPVHEKRIATIHTPPADDFHVYSVEWTSSELVWYVDGREVARRQNQYWHQPLDVVVSLGLRPPLTKAPQASGFPTFAEIDYVRVWSLPQNGE